MTAGAAYERLTGRLRDRGSKVTENGRGVSAQCPAHEDRDPSLSVTPIGGMALIHCHAGCDTADVLAALGLTMSDLYDEHEARYPYDDGRVVTRYYAGDRKRFRQAGADGTPTLYRAEEVRLAVLAGRPIHLVEGEKDVEAVRASGATATTAPMGADNFAKVDASPLTGAEVVAVVDRDTAGDKWARQVAAKLEGVAASVRFARAAVGKDAADHIAAGHSLAELEPYNVTEPGPPYKVRRLADVEPERVEWLWPRWIPRAMTTVLDGPPGAGKSTLALDIAARITTGRPMPGEELATVPPSAVVLMTAEDPLGPVVRPRLDAAGADTALVYALETVRRFDHDGAERWAPPTIPDDLDALERLMVDTGAVLVIVDVLTAYLSGRHDSHRDQDVRAALAPLAAIAERTGAAVVMLRHPRKSGGTAQQAGGGSIAIGGAARSWIAAGPDPADETGARRVLAAVRPSLTAAPASLGYQLTATDPMSPAHVEWTGTVDVSADALYTPAPSEDERTERDEAAEWLRDFLAEGPAPVADVKAAAQREGLAWRTVQRAREKAAVEAHREGKGKAHRSVWQLVPPPSGTSTDDTSWHELESVSDQQVRGPDAPTAANSRQHTHAGTSCAENGSSASDPKLTSDPPGACAEPGCDEPATGTDGARCAWHAGQHRARQQGANVESIFGTDEAAS